MPNNRKYAWINEGSKATLATHRTTHQGPRQRTRVVDLFGQHVQACTCMDVQESQSNWPDMRKNPGQPGFCSTGFRKLTERTGTEQPTNSWGNSHFDTTRDAKYDARPLWRISFDLRARCVYTLVSHL